MDTTVGTTEVATDEISVANIDMKLEVVVIPVSDVDRAKAFYGSLGWRLDADFPFDNGVRIVQFTPPGSAGSIQFGAKLTSAVPGSAQNLYLIVSDIEAARDKLGAHGVEVSEVFHPGTPGAQFQPDGTERSDQGARARPRHLRLVRHVQRPRRQSVAAPGSHDAAAGPRRRGRDVVRLRRRPRGRFDPCLDGAR